MSSCRPLVAVLAAVAASMGCSVIAGKEDIAGPAQLRIVYRETLRNQESLRGASFREPDFKPTTASSLQRPSSVTADNYRVYVTDLSPVPRLVVFDRGDRTMTILSAPSPTAVVNERFLFPTGVAVDEGGLIYVVDSQLGRVFGLDRNGALLLTIGKMGDLVFPSAVAVDTRRGRLYVSDKQGHVVRVYSIGTLGSRLFDIGGSGKKQDLKSPVGVALDRSGNCYVLDTHGTRIHVFDTEGKFLRMFPLSGKYPGGKIKPAGIAVDSVGHMYVTDSLNNLVLIFGADGALLQSWGRTGSMNSDFWMPAGIFIDSHDLIYIADQVNGRIQVYQYEK